MNNTIPPEIIKQIEEAAEDFFISRLGEHELRVYNGRTEEERQRWFTLRGLEKGCFTEGAKQFYFAGVRAGIKQSVDEFWEEVGKMLKRVGK